MHHVAIGDGATAAGVVASHAAQGGLRTGRDIDRIPQTMRSKGCVQVIQYQAGLDFNRAFFNVHTDHVAQMFAMVNHQTRADRLPALAGTAATWHERHFQVATNVERGFYLISVARDKHSHRHLLVNRRVCGVTTPVCC